MRTLLLADESTTVQRVIVLTFAQEPVRVVTASDGHQAMDRVVVERPDIVLVGTTLPHVNGYDLSRFVRSKAESKDVPVLLLSGAFESINEAELLSSGANGVIEKPVEPTAVIRRVKELLGLKAKDTAPPAGRLVTPAPPPAGPWPMPVPTMPRAVTNSWPMPAAAEELRDQTPEKDAGPVEDAPGRDDYLESLGDAFDTLDQQLAGRKPSSQQRNPSPALDQFNPSGDSRSASQTPMAPPPAAPPVFEVDDEWFAEDQSAREARELEQRELAREMGIHEVQLSEPPTVAQPANHGGVDRGDADRSTAIAAGPVEPSPVVAPPGPVTPRTIVEPPHPVEVRHVQEPVTPIVEVALASAADASHQRDTPPDPSLVIEMTLSAHRDAEDLSVEPIARTLPIDFFGAASTTARQPAAATAQGTSPAPPAAEMPRVINAFPASISVPRRETRDVADDFEALLAFEQGAKPLPPMIEPIIHAVTPEITAAMLQEIATTVADRLIDKVRIEPVAPHITGAMLEQIAVTVSRRLHDSIRIEPAVADITAPMLAQIAADVADRLRDGIRVEPRAPQISGEMIETLAYQVSGTLKDHVRVEPAAPVITEAIVQQMAATLAERMAGLLHVEAPAPEISGEMLDRVAGTVADRLKDSVRVEPVAPPITDAMLDRVAENVSARLRDSIRVEPAIPELNSAMLDQIASTVAARLTDTVRDSVRVETVAPAITIEMLDHVAARVAERLQSSMPPPPVPPQITEDMLQRVAALVAERMQGSFSMDHLRDSMTGAIRETVRAVVAETSERLVREEIERIRSRAQ